MARDGHTFSTYIAKPSGKARGGVVIVQEIFGLAPHILRVTDSYAAAGLPDGGAGAVRPRRARDLVLGYSPPEVEQGLGYRKQIPNRQGGARYRRGGGDLPPRRQGRGDRLLLGRHASPGRPPANCRSAPRSATTAAAFPRSCRRHRNARRMLHFGEQDRSHSRQRCRARSARHIPQGSLPSLRGRSRLQQRRSAADTTMPPPARWRASAPPRFWRSTSASRLRHSMAPVRRTAGADREHRHAGRTAQRRGAALSAPLPVRSARHRSAARCSGCRCSMAWCCRCARRAVRTSTVKSGARKARRCCSTPRACARRWRASSAMPAAALRVEQAFLYSPPFVAQALEQLRSAGVRRLLIAAVVSAGQRQHHRCGLRSGGAGAAQTGAPCRSCATSPAIAPYPNYIGALANSVREHWSLHGRNGHLLMSFHGIPQSYRRTRRSLRRGMSGHRGAARRGARAAAAATGA